MLIPETLLHNEVELRALSYLLNNHKLINTLKQKGIFYNKDYADIYQALYSLKDVEVISNELLKSRLKSEQHVILNKLKCPTGYTEQDFSADISFLKENGYLVDLWKSNEEINLKIPLMDRNSLFDELNKWRQRLDSLEKHSAAANKNALVRLDSIVDDFFLTLKERADNPNALLGVATGLDSLDNMIFGLVPKNFIVVAGRPGAGKTAFLTTILRNFILRREKKSFLFFSLEMSKTEIMQRLMSSIARVKFKRVRAATLTKDEWLRLAWARMLILNTNIYIDDTPSISIDYIDDKISDFGDTSVVGLDYIQLATATAENKRLEVSTICNGAKSIAKKYDVAFMGLAQLNREGEKNILNRKPTIERLKESGGIEEAADCILMLYRDKYYDKNTPYGDLAEIIVGKQRNGETGTVYGLFLGEYVSFENAITI